MRPLELIGKITLPLLCMHLVFLLLWAEISALLERRCGVVITSWLPVLAINVAGPLVLVGLIGLLPNRMRAMFGLKSR